ncbi:hypothetical protein J576_2074 [Acinetobacter sp. 766875]|nr:hypothetical protein ACINNAV57_2735 [Acinetobacter baumannii Naval-57]EXE50165.1 hypothetical protein J576_2074 [Acinetobacter sp. 766875]EXG31065.1 hypothetical protein J717_3491 [Acinetobacter baumannii 121738]
MIEKIFAHFIQLFADFEQNYSHFLLKIKDGIVNLSVLAIYLKYLL